MTVKSRGIRLKQHLDLQDQGQQKLLQVTFSQLAFLNQSKAPPFDNTEKPDSPLVEPEKSTRISPERRRIIARMLRIELEATLAMLDQTLDKTSASSQRLFGDT